MTARKCQMMFLTVHLMDIYWASGCYFSRCFGIQCEVLRHRSRSARAGRVNFGQPLSLTLIKRITAKMTIVVTIKGTKRPLRLKSEIPCKTSHFFSSENVQFATVDAISLIVRIFFYISLISRLLSSLSFPSFSENEISPLIFTANWRWIYFRNDGDNAHELETNDKLVK